MQRQGSLTWTGDVPVTWDALVSTPGYVLNWELAGTAYITCDTGGFNGPDVRHFVISLVSSECVYSDNESTFKTRQHCALPVQLPS